MRLDRAASVGLFHPMTSLLARHRPTRVPILMYHGIRSELGTRHPYFETSTAPELFAKHMEFLRENGYATVSINEVVEAAMVGLNGRKRVAITFDDGFRDFYTHAFPVLSQYGMKATVFIVSGWTKDERVVRDGREYLTWQEVREMNAHWIRIGSHTVNHPELYALDASSLEYEVRESKEEIESKLGEAIDSFSHPYAFPEQDRRYVERLKELLQAHGYQNGVSTILGTASQDHDWFFLPRLPVNSHDDLRFFRAKLEGGYDWLHPAQKLYKMLKKQITKPSMKGQLAHDW